MIRVGVAGAGLIGRERIQAVRQLAAEKLPIQLVGVCESDTALAPKIAQETSTTVVPRFEDLLRLDPDWVIVALPHDAAVGATLAALEHGCSVLLEKPLGRDLDEARQLYTAARGRLHVGFNYRYFPGIRRAIQDARSGLFGDLIAVDLLLGHGCHPDQEKTWKLDPIRAGGGCLIDPGVHLLDLCVLLAGPEIEVAGGTSWSGFWRTGIEEDVQLVLRGRGGVSISLQVSIVRWRSTFQMSIHGAEGYGVVTGRNRSYGTQQYRTGLRWGWKSGVSQAESEKLAVESDGLDVFLDETRALLIPGAEPTGWPGPATAKEALDVMELLDRIRDRIGLPRQVNQLQETT